MRLAILLMSSAATLAPSYLAADELVVDVAQVHAVGICDLYGNGYFYVPGTETCLSIGGYVQFDAWAYDRRKGQHFFNLPDYFSGAVSATTDPSNPLAQSSGAVAGYLYDTDGYDARWAVSEEIKLAATAKTTTDLGVVGTYVRFVIDNEIDQTNTSDARSLARTTRLDRAYAAIGPVFVGYYDSIFAYQAAALSLDGNINADPKVNQFQLNHAWGPWRIAAALEDPRNWVREQSNITGDYPSLALALTGTWENAYLQAALGATDRTTGTGWGAQVSGSLGSGTKPQMQLNLAYSENAPVYVGGKNCIGACGNEGAWWSAMLSAQMNLTRTLSVNATSSYLDGPSSYEWQAAGGIGWAPTGAALVSAELLYVENNGTGSFGLHTQLKTSFGND